MASSSSNRAGVGSSDEDLQYDALQSILPAHINHHCKVPNCRTPDNHLVTYDINTVGHIFRWADKEKKAEINRAFRTKGGWEGWLQVELALWLERQPGTASVLREQHVYNSTADAVDILVLTSEGTRNVIELKCESVNQDCLLARKDGVAKEKDGSPVPKTTHRYSGTRATQHQAARAPSGPMIPSIAKRLEEDWEKRKSVAGKYRPCQYTELGISMTKGARDWVLQEKVRDPNYFQHVTAQQVYGPAAKPDDYFVLWFKSEILH